MKAMLEAQLMSSAHPHITYYVMDKRNKTAACHGSEWVVKEKILDGWHTVAKYINGVKITK